MAQEETDIGPKLDKWQGLLIFLIAQTMSGIWWAANVSSSLQVLKDKTVEITANIHAAAANRYTAQDAARDLAYRDKESSEFKVRISEMDRRVMELERRIGLKVQ